MDIKCAVCKWLCVRRGCPVRTKEENQEHVRKYRFVKKVEKMKEKNTTCQVCYFSPAETLHHKNENHADNKKENLLPVCRECHLDIEHECDYDLAYASQIPQNAHNEPFKGVIQSQKDPRRPFKLGETVTLCSKSKPYKKIYANVSLRALRMIMGLGYEYYNQN